MTLTLTSLASGSSGNAFLLRAGATCILIDAGLPASTIMRHLADQHLEPAQLAAVLLTHEHSDHVQAAGTLSRRLGLPVVANAATLDAAERQVGEMRRRQLPVGDCLDLGEIAVASFAVPHDAAAPVGYLISHCQGTICLATDLGAACADLRQPLAAADLIVIEANHDRERLIRGPYPPALKARILGEQGHLSNDEAAELLVPVLRDRPRCVWLAHLSAVNNGPTLARRTVAGRLAAAGVRQVRLEVLKRDRPSPTWSAADAGWQMPLL